LNILIVSQYFWPENFRINDVALGLKEKGHSVSVLTGLPNYPEGKIHKGYSFFHKVQNYKGISVYRSPLIPRGSGSSIRLFLNYISFAIFSCIKSLFIMKNKYDAIFVFEPSPITVVIPAILIKKIKKIPITLWVQDLWPESIKAVNVNLPNLIIYFLNKFVSYLYSYCDMILVTSKSYIGSITQKNISSSKILFFPQWAEPLFKPVKINHDVQKILPNGFTIMFAGNIGHAQDFETIIKAANITKNEKRFNWVILGSGRMKDYVESEINRLKIKNFHLLGRFPLSDMPKFFALADVMLISLKKSPIFSLTIPAKIQSYLACGKPILSMLEGEGAKIIEESSAGVNCKPGDYKSLARNAIKFKNEKTKLLVLGNNAKSYYLENFNRENLLDKLSKILKSTINNQKSN
jgi:colanic acid biosynthesis glycosyl transferase WcaI